MITKESAGYAGKRTVRIHDKLSLLAILCQKNIARFVGNPQIAAPTKRNLDLAHQPRSETFPIPLPPYLPRSISLPTTTTLSKNPQLSRAGTFSLSLRGAQKNFRHAGSSTQALVLAVEDALLIWIVDAEIVLEPDAPPPPVSFPGTSVGGIGGVREVERTSGYLVWWIENDTWARYVVHCCARYHQVVSFSKILLSSHCILLTLVSGKDTPKHRLTHLLRPNHTRLHTTHCAQPCNTPNDGSRNYITCFL
jgi:hypothetical protein